MTQHGTNAGYNAHFSKGGDRRPCEPCKKAHARYRAEHRKAVYVNRGNLTRPSLGVQRRLRALMRIGWRAEDIAAVAVPDLKSGKAWVHYLLTSDWGVHPDTFEAVSRAYERLSAKPGPSQRLRTYACNKGWAPPMAWDDIDDPDCKPQGHLRPSEIRKIKNGRA